MPNNIPQTPRDLEQERQSSRASHGGRRLRFASVSTNGGRNEAISNARYSSVHQGNNDDLMMYKMSMLENMAR